MVNMNVSYMDSVHEISRHRHQIDDRKVICSFFGLVFACYYISIYVRFFFTPSSILNIIFFLLTPNIVQHKETLLYYFETVNNANTKIHK